MRPVWVDSCLPQAPFSLLMLWHLLIILKFYFLAGFQVVLKLVCLGLLSFLSVRYLHYDLLLLTFQKSLLEVCFLKTSLQNKGSLKCAYSLCFKGSFLKSLLLGNQHFPRGENITDDNYSHRWFHKNKLKTMFLKY